MKQFLVTPAAMRPGSSEERCFYCRQPIGAFHGPECVLVKKFVNVRMTVDYVIEVPANWDKHMIEFHRNDGTWCANNALDELAELTEEDEGTCMCSGTHFEYLGGDTEPFLDEGGPAKPADTNTRRFRTKPTEVEAFQATRAARADNSDWPQWMHEARQKDFREPGAVSCEDYPNSNGTDRFAVCLSSGYQYSVVHWNDWIIRHPDGELRVCTAEEFDEHFEPA